MTNEQRTQIIGYAKKLNSTLPDATDETLVLAADIVGERVLLFLNRTDLPDNLLRTVSQVLVKVYLQITKESTQTETEQAIASVSDNGQSVSYKDHAVAFLANADDEEIFGSFAALLKRYRRITVVGQ